jgi:ATP-dependent DNA ligase
VIICLCQKPRHYKEPRGVSGILFSEALVAEGAVVFAKACQLDLDGVVSKLEGGFYKSERSRNWLKTINPDFVRT